MLQVNPGWRIVEDDQQRLRIRRSMRTKNFQKVRLVLLLQGVRQQDLALPTAVLLLLCSPCANSHFPTCIQHKVPWQSRALP